MTSKKKAAITILLSFLLGGVAGILVDRALLSGPLRPSRPSSRYEAFKARMHKDLDLSVIQQDQFEELMQRRQRAFDEFRKTVQERYLEMREATRDSIRSLLTPSQLAKFEDLIKEFDTRRRRDEKKK